MPIKHPTRYKIDIYKHAIIDQKTNTMVCEESAAEQFFAKKTNVVKRQIQAIDEQINELKLHRSKIAEKCRHINAVHEYKSDTGNYDSSQDRYWIYFRCYDCNKRWMEDQ